MTKSKKNSKLGKIQAAPAATSRFIYLPIEIILHVMRLLPQSDKLACAGVCKAWKSAIYDNPTLWQTFLIRPSLRNTSKQAWFFEKRLKGTNKGITEIIVPKHSTEKHYNLLIESTCPFSVDKLVMVASFDLVESAWHRFAHGITHADIKVVSARHRRNVTGEASIEDLLSEAPNLRTLKLGQLPFHPTGHNSEEPCSFNLVELSLSHLSFRINRMPNDNLDIYSKLVKLELWAVQPGRLVTSICNSAPLEHITLGDCSLVPGCYFPNLKRLKLFSTTYHQIEHLQWYHAIAPPTPPFPSNSSTCPVCHQLRAIDFQDIPITPLQLFTLARGSRLLQAITMIRTRGITREHLCIAIHAWPKLERLELRVLNQIPLTAELVHRLRMTNFSLRTLILETFAEPVGTALRHLIENRKHHSDRQVIQDLQIYDGHANDRQILEELTPTVPSYYAAGRYIDSSGFWTHYTFKTQN